MWRSVLAVFVGFLVGAALSLGTDQVLHVLHVYPPWDQPMRDPALNLLALSYRCVYNVVGFYLIAKLAPRNPMRHIWIGAAVGCVLSSGGVIAAMKVDLGPLWYPILLALSTLPCAWVAGSLYLRVQVAR